MKSTSLTESLSPTGYHNREFFLSLSPFFFILLRCEYLVILSGSVGAYHFHELFCESYGFSNTFNILIVERILQNLTRLNLQNICHS